jgi:hypothetical protein
VPPRGSTACSIDHPANVPAGDPRPGFGPGIGDDPLDVGPQVDARTRGHWHDEPVARRCPLEGVGQDRPIGSYSLAEQSFTA